MQKSTYHIFIIINLIEFLIYTIIILYTQSAFVINKLKISYSQQSGVYQGFSL